MEPWGTQGYVAHRKPGEGLGERGPGRGCLLSCGQRPCGWRGLRGDAWPDGARGLCSSKNRAWETQRSLAVKGLTPGPVSHSTLFFFPLPAPPPPSSLYPKPWVFPLPPLLVTRPCFLPEIKGLSTEIPQEGGGGTQPLPRASLKLSLPVPNLACPIHTELLQCLTS